MFSLERGSELRSFSATISGMSTSPAYSNLDKVGSSITLSGATRKPGGVVILESIVVVDTGGLSPFLRVHFFQADPGGSDNAAMNPDDTEMTNDYQGSITINSWVTLTSNSYAVHRGLALPLASSSSSSNLIMLVQAAQAFTGSATSGQFVFRLGFI